MNVALPFTQPSLSGREACGAVEAAALASPSLNIPTSTVSIAQAFDSRVLEEVSGAGQLSTVISMLHNQLTLRWHKVRQPERTVQCCGNHQTEPSKVKSHLCQASESQGRRSDPDQSGTCTPARLCVATVRTVLLSTSCEPQSMFSRR